MQNRDRIDLVRLAGNAVVATMLVALKAKRLGMPNIVSTAERAKQFMDRILIAAK